MKRTFLILSILSVMTSLSLGEESKSSHDDFLKPALKMLEKDKDYLFKHERVLAEVEHGKEKVDTYMEYFEKGMNSKTGTLMMHSHESIWLEVAYRRGFAYQQAFIRGYFAGKLSPNEEPNQSQ